MDLLGDCPPGIDTLEQQFKYACENRRMAEFNRKLSEWIYICQMPARREIALYVRWRQGHFAKQDVMEGMGKVYVPEF